MLTSDSLKTLCCLARLRASAPHEPRGAREFQFGSDERSKIECRGFDSVRVRFSMVTTAEK
jgi:hypothetical protein